MTRHLLLLVAFISLLTPIHSLAQTFRITDVQVDGEDYNTIAGKTIGKIVKLKVFDNSITIDIEGRDHLVLKHNSGGYYSTGINHKPQNTEYFEAYLHAGWTGTITSFKLNYTYQQEQPPYKQYTVKMTVKP